jgi:SAM-dependent methyltransferase
MTSLAAPDPARLALFEQILATRYEAEFSRTTLWPGHREWWLEDMGWRHEARIHEYLARLDGLVGWRDKVCVDLGCGSGASLIALTALGAFAFGVDNELVGDDLELARSRAAMHGMDIRVVSADATCLPLPDESVDAALSTSVAEHVEDVTAYLAEANRILVRGGKLVFTTDNRASLREAHSHLVMAHWLPYPAYAYLARRKMGLPRGTRIHVYPRTLWAYRRLLEQAGFRIVADRWDLFLTRPAAQSSGAKRRLARLCHTSGLPLAAVLPGTAFIAEKR